MIGGNPTHRRAIGKVPGRRGDKFPGIDPLIRQGEFAATVPLIEALIETDHGNYAAWRLLSEVRLGLRQFEPARKAIERAVRLRPDNPHYRLLHGICLKETGAYREALAVLDDYLQNDPRNIRAHDALKVCHYRLGDTERALAAGRQKLILMDDVKAPEPLPKFLKRPDAGKCVFSFSLWGDHEQYCYGAMVNLRLSRIFFPDWLCRFYVADDVPRPVVDDLNRHGAELVRAQKEYPSIPNYMWRFLVADDPEIALFACRDTDSRICLKQAVAMRLWIDEPHAFHVMRDHVFHNELMLAGLWSGVGGSAIKMKGRIERFHKKNKYDSRYGVDQIFLSTEIWPRIKHDCLVHDSHYAYPNASGFPLGGRGDDNHHVGIGVHEPLSIKAELRLFGISFPLYRVGKGPSGS